MKPAVLPLLVCLAITWPGTAGAIEFSAAELSQAQALQQRLLTLDTHLDTPANLPRAGFDILQRHAGSAVSQVDYPRMVEGALDGGFWAIYTGQGDRSAAAHLHDRDAGLERLLEIREMVAAHPDRFGLALTPEDAKRIKAAGKRVVFISMENASPLVADPSLLSFYQQAGLRMVSLAHFLNNEFADSATDPKGAEWQGLSPAGRQLVAEANRLGILLDQSHSSDAVFDDLLEASKVPFVLSHSGARAIHDHPRNIDDERLRKLAAKGGVIQVNAYGGYLIDVPKSKQRIEAEKALEARFGEFDAMSMAQSEAYGRALKELDAKYPLKQATLDDFLVHLGHILEVAGPEHTGIGMDWDGGGGVQGMEDVSQLPKITAWLLRRGYNEQQIADIWGGNVMRVMRQAQDYAAAQAGGAKP